MCAEVFPLREDVKILNKYQFIEVYNIGIRYTACVITLSSYIYIYIYTHGSRVLDAVKAYTSYNSA